MKEKENDDDEKEEEEVLNLGSSAKLTQPSKQKRQNWKRWPVKPSSQRAWEKAWKDCHQRQN